MSILRAGRSTGVVVSRGTGPIPQPTRRAGEGLAAVTRRRAALSHSGHRMGDVTGFDGEVCVRYEAVYRRAEPASGERRLLLAVLEDGIRTLLKYAQATHGRAHNLRREALSWVTTLDRSDVFSFENICEALGIDAGRLRLRVLGEARTDPPGQAVH